MVLVMRAVCEDHGTSALDECTMIVPHSKAEVVEHPSCAVIWHTHTDVVPERTLCESWAI